MNDRYNDQAIGPMVSTAVPMSQGIMNVYPARRSPPRVAEARRLAAPRDPRTGGAPGSPAAPAVGSAAVEGVADTD